jgi:hypothetical protein
VTRLGRHPVPIDEIGDGGTPEDPRPNQLPGAPHPRFPVEFCGFPALHAPFPKERRTRGSFESCVQEIRGISLVFREMWDTTALTLKPVAD